MRNVHRRSSAVNTRPPQPARRSRSWRVGALTIATALVSAGCGVISGEPGAPVPLYLAIVVVIVVMGVQGLVRIAAGLLGGGNQLLVRLVRLALLVGSIMAVAVVAVAVYAVWLISAG